MGCYCLPPTAYRHKAPYTPVSSSVDGFIGDNIGTRSDRVFHN